MSLPEKIIEEDSEITSIPLNLYLSVITRQHNIYMNHELKEYNISAGEFPILMKIYFEGKKTQQDIANSFYLTQGTVARTVRNLEDKGFIKRKIDDKNRRRNFVYLKDKGKDIAEHIYNLENKWEGMILEDLSPSETRSVKRILYKATRNSLDAINFDES